MPRAAAVERRPVPHRLRCRRGRGASGASPVRCSTTTPDAPRVRRSTPLPHAAVRSSSGSPARPLDAAARDRRRRVLLDPVWGGGRTVLLHVPRHYTRRGSRRSPSDDAVVISPTTTPPRMPTLKPAERFVRVVAPSAWGRTARVGREARDAAWNGGTVQVQVLRSPDAGANTSRTGLGYAGRTLGGWPSRARPTGLLRGDTALHDEFAEIGRTLPVRLTRMSRATARSGGPSTSDRAADAPRLVGGDLMLPVHWGCSTALHAGPSHRARARGGDSQGVARERRARGTWWRCPRVDSRRAVARGRGEPRMRPCSPAGPVASTATARASDAHAVRRRAHSGQYEAPKRALAIPHANVPTGSVSGGNARPCVRAITRARYGLRQPPAGLCEESQASVRRRRRLGCAPRSRRPHVRTTVAAERR